MLKFFAPKSECFTKYDAFCSYFFDYACLGHKAYCYQKGSKLWKNCIHQKTCLKMPGEGGASSKNPPMPALITMFPTATPSRRFGFSTGMAWDKFCQSCFELITRTALVQFGHFTLKTRARFQKGGFRPPKPLLGAPLVHFVCNLELCNIIVSCLVTVTLTMAIPRWSIDIGSDNLITHVFTRIRVYKSLLLQIDRAVCSF